MTVHLLFLLLPSSFHSRVPSSIDEVVSCARSYIPPPFSSMTEGRYLLCPVRDDSIDAPRPFFNRSDPLCPPPDGRLRAAFLFSNSNGTEIGGQRGNNDISILCENPPRTGLYWVCVETVFQGKDRRLLEEGGPASDLFPSLGERVSYYAGSKNCPPQKERREDAPSLIEDDPFSIFHCPFRWRCGVTRASKKERTSYGKDMERYCSLSPRPNLSVRVFFGDLEDQRRVDSFTITKSRLVKDRCGILLPLNTANHWLFRTNIVQFRRTMWGRKVPRLVWRGTTTGDGVRRDFVHHLSGRGHDVRFTKVIQKRRDWITNTSIQMGDHLSHPSLLKFKYLLVLPGNDVATSLKWALSSNSVVLMPPPEKETWLMEGLLKAWVHYVPVETPMIVEERIRWLKENDREARRISSSANRWMSSLLSSFLSPVPQVMTLAEERGRQASVFKP